jgi:hypothetical protein
MRISRRHVLTAAGSVPALTLLRPVRALGAVAGANVGAVKDILNFAWGTPPGLDRGELEFEDDVFMNELVETDGESALIIIFADGSKLTVGENSAVIIDEFVYDPSTADGLTTLDLAKGVFRYVSGSMPKDNITINTPTITTGLRGTELKFTVRDDGETEMSTLSGEALCRSKVSGKELLIRARESAIMAADGKWRGGVRAFVHQANSVAIDDSFEAARSRWRVRKERRRRAEPRQTPRNRIRLPTEQ